MCGPVFVCGNFKQEIVHWSRTYRTNNNNNNNNNNSNFVTLWDVKRSLDHVYSLLLSFFLLFLPFCMRMVEEIFLRLRQFSLFLSMHLVSDLYKSILFNASLFQLNKIGFVRCSLCWSTHCFYGQTKPNHTKRSQAKPSYTRLK